MNYLERLIENARRVFVRPEPVEEFMPQGLREPARAPIRARVMLACAILVLPGMLAAFKLGNPIALIHDARVGTDYHGKPLTSLAAGGASSQVWIGSEGAGIRVYAPDYHFFQPEITRVSSPLLGDHILSLDFRGGLAAVSATDAHGHPGGAQLVTLKGAGNTFWPAPVVDLSRFPGLSDQTASAVAEAPDHRLLVIGTRTAGLGVYDTTKHSWRALVQSPEIPSNHITDLVLLQAPGSLPVLWIATDHGLSVGRIDGQCALVKIHTYRLADGLAGEDIQRIKAGAGALWYRTAGQGFGRVMIQLSGEPRSGSNHELLISERTLPGISDAGLRLAASSPAGPTTWFLAVDDARRLLGRYREQPHDTQGFVLPPDFPFDKFTCIATEAETGQAVIVGTDDGAWLFHEQLSNGSSGEITFNKLSEIDGGNIGPNRVRIEEVALGGGFALAKTKTGAEPYALQRTPLAGASASTWQPLVGAGRFRGLHSAREMTAATRSGQLVLFGTAGQGIGAWDRAALEVRQEYHTGASDPAKKLRDNTVLDLAALASQVYQVTGDHAVDVFDRVKRRTLVPPSSAPFAPEQLNAVAVDDVRLAAAGAGHVCVYGVQQEEASSEQPGLNKVSVPFSWVETAPLAGLRRLHLAPRALWGLTESEELHCLQDLGENAFDKTWQVKLAGVADFAPTPTMLGAISRAGGSVPGLVLLDSSGGGEIKEVTPNVVFGSGDSRRIQPKTLGPATDAWKFATVDKQDLVLAGAGRELQRYTVANHAWQPIAADPSVRPPYRAASRTAKSWWLLDAGQNLHRFGGGTVGPRLESEVEKMSGAGALLVARLTGNRWIRLDDAAQRKVLVGDAFEGDLAHITAAAERTNQLVVLADGVLGLYDPKIRHWKTVRPPGPAAPLQRLHVAGNAIWAADARRLFHLSGDGQLQLVQAGGQPLDTAQAASDGQALWVLASGGALWRIPAGQPVQPVLRLPASKVADTANPVPIGLLRQMPLFYDGQRFHSYYGAPEVWHAQPTTARPARFALSAHGERLLGWNNDQAWIFDGLGTPGPYQERPILPPSLAGRAHIVATAVSELEAGCLVSVKGEEGLKAVAMRGDQPGLPTPGAALPASAPTVRFIKDGSDILRLDKAGKLGRYDVDARAWAAETVPAPFDEIWTDEQATYGWQRTSGLLAQRDSRAWNVLAKNTAALVRTPGALAWKTREGHWTWRTPSGGTGTLFSPATGQPSLTGPISHVLEWQGRLLMRDAQGHTALYDPDARRWENAERTVVLDFQLDASGGQPVLLVNVAGQGRLFDLTRDNSGLQLTPTLNPAATVSVRSFTTGHGMMLVLGADRRIYWVIKGNPEPVAGAEGVTAIWPTIGGFEGRTARGTIELTPVKGEDVQVRGSADDGPLTDGAPASTPSPASDGLSRWNFRDGKLTCQLQGAGTPWVPMKLQPHAGWEVDDVKEVRLDGERAWLRTPAGWRVMQRTGDRFEWVGWVPDAPANAQADTVPPADPPVDSNQQPLVFDARLGLFDTDIFLGLGSGGGRLWVLTAAGLERLSDRVRQALPAGLHPGDLRFGRDDEIVDRKGRTQLAWEGDAWQAAQAPKALPEPAGAWRYHPASGFRRARPQEPGVFDPVSLNAQRRWNFEEITALSAAERLALLSTEFGPVVVGPEGDGPVAAWPASANAAYPAAGAIAEGNRWRRAADRLPFANEPLPLAEGQFRWTPDAGSRRLQIQLPGDAAPSEVQGGRFNRDMVHDAAPSADVIALSTAAGLATLPAEGGSDMKVLPGGGGRRFDLVAFGGAVFARPTSGGGTRFVWRAGAWSECPAAEAAAAAAESIRQVANGHPWRVTRGTAGELEFALQRGGPAGQEFRTVPFFATRGTFGFDLFRSVAAGAAKGEWIVGTESGLVTLKSDGELKRVWCDPATDGVGPEAVDQMVLAEDQALLARVGRRVLSLPKGGVAFEESTAEAFSAAQAVIADDPTGWQIKQVDRTPRLRWAGQPVTLVPWANGRSRFAHNVICSVALEGNQIYLGTQGGLLRLRNDDSRKFELLVAPFSSAGPAPEPLTWLGLHGQRLSVRGKPGAAWEVDLVEFKTVAPEANPPPANEVATDEVATDDLLSWRHPGAGVVETAFQPGRTIPDHLAPVLDDGTFTFLNLELSGAGTPPATLRQSPEALFWLSQAGVIQYDPKEGAIVKVHAASATGGIALAALHALRWDVPRQKILAGHAQAEVEFDGQAWQPLTGSGAPDLALVGDSRRLSWRQETGHVVVTVKQTDDPDRPFFGTGRPRVDEVLDFASGGPPDAPAMLLASNAGIVEYGLTDFAWGKMHAKVFQGQPVTGVAAAEVADQPRQAARTAAGGFEFSGAAWQPGADVAAVFARDQARANWPGRWLWSQRPGGLTCQYLNTNGKPFLTGVAAGAPPAFSQEKLALDDIRGALLAEGELVLATRIGCARYRLDEKAQTSTWYALDAWREGGDDLPLGPLGGLVRHNQDFLASSEAGAVRLRPAAPRRWQSAGDLLQDRARRQVLADGDTVWEVLLTGRPNEVAVTHGSGGKGPRWYSETQGATPVRAVAVSPRGLWFLLGNDLYHASAVRAERSIMNQVPFKPTIDSVAR